MERKAVDMAHIAKALTALVVVFVLGLLTKGGIVVDENALSAVIEALITSALVYAIPNRPTITTTTIASPK